MARIGGFVTAVIVVAAFYFIVYQNPKFQTWIQNFGKGGGGTRTVTTTKKGGKPTKSGGGTSTTGGGSFSGTHIYKTTGKRCNCANEGAKALHTSKGTCTTSRANCNNCGLLNYEATGTLQFTQDCSCGGDEATIKHYGPTHQDGNCCWAMSVVNQSGTCAWGGEGPHGGTTNKNQGSLGSVGNLAGKKVGIKSVIWKTATGAHQELYVDTSASGSNWKKMGARNMTQWGDVEKTNVITKRGGPQQVEFRNDCKGALWSNVDVSEIVPPAGAAAAQIDQDYFDQYRAYKMYTDTYSPIKVRVSNKRWG